MGRVLIKANAKIELVIRPETNFRFCQIVISRGWSFVQCIPSLLNCLILGLPSNACSNPHDAKVHLMGDSRLSSTYQPCQLMLDLGRATILHKDLRARTWGSQTAGLDKIKTFREHSLNFSKLSVKVHKLWQENLGQKVRNLWNQESLNHYFLVMKFLLS